MPLLPRRCRTVYGSTGRQRTSRKGFLLMASSQSTRIIAVANQKGGVGKTTFALGLAGAVANTGRRVLVVDMDPQANASQTLLPDYDVEVQRDDFYTVNDILEHGVEPADLPGAIHRTGWAGVDLIPSQQALAHRDVEGATGIEMRLRRVLRGLDLLDEDYDVVLLDCPPSVGRLTVNAFLAASEIVLISHPDSYGHNALNQIDETLKTVRDAYDHDIEVAGLVINMFEETTEAIARTEQLRARFGDKVLLVMRKRAVLRAAQSENRSVFAMGTHPAAREVAGWFTDLARALRLIGARETVPEVEVGEADSTVSLCEFPVPVAAGA